MLEALSRVSIDDLGGISTKIKNLLNLSLTGAIKVNSKNKKNEEY